MYVPYSVKRWQEKTGEFGKMNTIHQYFTKVATNSRQHFPRQTVKMIDFPVLPCQNFALYGI